MLGITDEETEGTWKTFDGQLLTYLNWNAGEPNEGSSSNYAFMYTKKFERNNPAALAGTWNDAQNPDESMLCTYEPSVDFSWSFSWFQALSNDCCTFETFLDLPAEQNKGRTIL